MLLNCHPGITVHVHLYIFYLQHVFMVLAEYAFILRVIQMEKRKGDAARRTTLGKSVKAVVAANQVREIQGSQATLKTQFRRWIQGSQMHFLLFNLQNYPFFASFILFS